jgi:hypothetical protein
MRWMKPERGRALRDEDDEKADGLDRPVRLPLKLKIEGAECRLWCVE